MFPLRSVCLCGSLRLRYYETIRLPSHHWPAFFSVGQAYLFLQEFDGSLQFSVHLYAHATFSDPAGLVDFLPLTKFHFDFHYVENVVTRI